MHSDHTTFTKTCTKCGVTKPLDEFYKNRQAKDGLTTVCKACGLEASLKRYRKNPVKARERARRWAQANPEKRREAERLWKKANREKVKAHQAVKRSIWAGELPPAADCFCFTCSASSDQGVRMEYHHVRYDKPLEVFPLCNQCHVDWHLANGGAE